MAASVVPMVVPGLGTDIRLACHGMDKNDNDFVVRPVGRSYRRCRRLCSACAKPSRRRFTWSDLGPFFVGKAIWQNQPESEK